MAWKSSCISPIDFRWEYLPTVEEVASKFAYADAEAAVHGDADGGDELTSFLAAFEAAKKLASAGYWEGDYRNPPVVFFLPTELEFQYAFAWKQDNNGSTFVVSPVALPWLDEHSI